MGVFRRIWTHMTGFLKMEQTVLFVNHPPPTPPATVVFNPSPTPPPRVVVTVVPSGPGFLSVVASMSGVVLAYLSFTASELELNRKKWDELKENNAAQIHDLKGRISVLDAEVSQAALEVVDLESRLWDSQKDMFHPLFRKGEVQVVAAEESPKSS